QTETSAIHKYKLDMSQIQYGSANKPSATVKLTNPQEETIEPTQKAQGSVEALYKTIDSLDNEELKLVDYSLNSVGRGKDALAESFVQLIVNDEQVSGRGSAQDVLAASANAFLNAVNRYIVQQTTK